VPANDPDRSRILAANLAKALNPVLASIQLTPTAGTFTGVLELPMNIPWDQVIIRAVTTGQDQAFGVWRVKVLRPPRPLKWP
jgi:hypothetical protein